MNRRVLYVAHALRPTEEEIAAISDFEIERGRSEYEIDARIPKSRNHRTGDAIRANLDRAMRWLSWLRRSFPETTFIAPWIVDILSGADDSDPAQREAGMQGNFAVIERCDGIVLCGPRVSEGMRREMEHGRAQALTEHDSGPKPFEVYDLTEWDPPPNEKPDDERDLTFAEFFAEFAEAYRVTPP